MGYLRVFRLVVLMVGFSTVAHAQLASVLRQAASTNFNLQAVSADDLNVMLEAIEQTTPLTATNAPQFGNFYSAQNPDWPPLPANMNGLAVWPLGNGFYLLSDQDFDYQAAEQENVALHEMAKAMGLGMDGEEAGSSFAIDTNGLWLSISSVSNGLAYLNLYHGTDYVYEVWSKPDLLASNWGIETEVFPGTNQDAMPFTVPELDRTNLFIWARDWTGITSGGNETPEWWFWKFFHTVDLSDTDLDSTGNNTLLYDYQNGFDPNIISFFIQLTNNYVNTSNAPVQLNILGGVPAYLAVLVNDMNQADALWQPYISSNIVATLGSTNGTYGIFVGLRGFPPDAVQTWQWTSVTLYSEAPTLTVTNPTTSTVSQSLIQLQGYASNPLDSLTFDVSNAAGIFTNQIGFLTGQFYDTNSQIFTTNYFQCYDIRLTSGLNTITLHATDLTGNTTTTHFSVTLDYSSDTTSPALAILWPQDGTAISGNSFTLQAQVDDDTATVTAQIVDPNGNTNTIQGLVERTGLVWVQNLPLAAGTNTLIVTAADAAGNSTTTNLTLVQSGVVVTMDPLPSDQLNQSSVTVTGTISDTNYDIWVNGTKATNSGDGTWEADNVPTSPTGIATFDVEIYVGDPALAGSQEFIQWQPPMVVLSDFTQHAVVDNVQYASVQWNYAGGGSWGDVIPPDGDGYTPPVVVPYYPVIFAPPWQNANAFYYNGNSYQTSVKTTVMIVPSGPKLPGVMKLYMVSASAMMFVPLISFPSGGDASFFSPDFLWPNNRGNMPVPSEQFLINDQPLVGNLTNDDGSIWGETIISAPAGALVPLTMTTANSDYNDYTFNMQATNVDLQIRDANTGTNLTTQTNTVIVGQQINLTCQLNVTNALLNNGLLTNFQWTVPGITFSDYVATASSAVLYTNYPTGNSNVVFYWANDGLMRVQCSATVDGKPVTGQAWFKVIRPEVTWTLTPKDSVAVDTNFFSGSQIYQGSYFLHCGKNISTNDAGMYFSFQVTDLKGYTGDYDIQFFQIVTVDWRKNEQGLGGYFVSGRGYDDQFPIPLFGYTKNSGYRTDSPASVLTESDDFYWRQDSFEDYLMFIPAGGKPVPLKLARWNWYGRATTNSLSTFVGVTPFTNPQAAVGTNCFVHPTWTNNIDNIKINWQYHGDAYPTP